MSHSTCCCVTASGGSCVTASHHEHIAVLLRLTLLASSHSDHFCFTPFIVVSSPLALLTAHLGGCCVTLLTEGGGVAVWRIGSKQGFQMMATEATPASDYQSAVFEQVLYRGEMY